eukprot:11165727-Lingulodinium_polyedra.AAC.1
MGDQSGLAERAFNPPGSPLGGLGARRQGREVVDVEHRHRLLAELRARLLVPEPHPRRGVRGSGQPEVCLLHKHHRPAPPHGNDLKSRPQDAAGVCPQLLPQPPRQELGVQPGEPEASPHGGRQQVLVVAALHIALGAVTSCPSGSRKSASDSPEGSRTGSGARWVALIHRASKMARNSEDFLRTKKTPISSSISSENSISPRSYASVMNSP